MFGIKTMLIKEQAEEIRILKRDKERLEFHITQLEEITQEHTLAVESIELDCGREYELIGVVDNE